MIELSLMFSLFIRMIIGFEDLNGVVVVEDDPGGEFLLQTEFLTGFIPELMAVCLNKTIISFR